MRTEERDALVRLYDERAAEMGYDVRTLGWKSVEDQALRFRVLADIADLGGSSVCDIGCGFGDLLPYLRGRFSEVDYAGVDITESLLKTAAQRHPGVPFRCVDILDESYADRYDYFLLSGALNYKLEDNLGFTRRMLEKMFALCERGVAVNFLSTYVTRQHPRNYHHDPGVVLGMAKAISPRVTVRHDYPLWEFTLYLYK